MDINIGMTKRLKFIRNTPYNGIDYGPDYAQRFALVETRQANIWIQRGRAVEEMEEIQLPVTVTATVTPTVTTPKVTTPTVIKK